MGGLVGADAACQQRAAVAGLTGTYKAWLADATSSPATRLTHHLGPYQLTTGVIPAQYLLWRPRASAPNMFLRVMRRSYVSCARRGSAGG